MTVLSQSNEELTWEQLCTMNGNPVFAVIDGVEILKMWVLVEYVREAHCVILTNNLGGRSEYYSDQELKEENLIIYRRPPKGDRKTK